MPSELAACFPIWLSQALFLTLLMSVTAWIAHRIKNVGLVDICWGGGFGLLAAQAAWMGHGTLPRRWLFTGMVVLASFRLGKHLWQRFWHEYPTEDGRYRSLRQAWAAKWPAWQVDAGFILLVYLQGSLMWLLSLPFALVANNTRPSLLPVEWIGLALWLLGFICEAVADRQLKQFKANPANRGQPCQAGLWRYSRHPNYFGEWLMWLAYWLFALASGPWGWLGLYAPFLMFYLLTRVTGVSATEAHILTSRGEAYRQYQKQTSAFFPWFPKKPSA